MLYRHPHNQARRHILLSCLIFGPIPIELGRSCRKFLLHKALVVTVPGKEFGMEGHLRLSYAGTVKGHHHRHRTHEMGTGSKLAQRNLHRRPQVDQGLAMNNLLNIKTPAEAQAAARKSEFGLENHGLTNLRKVYWNLPIEALYEEAIFRNEGKITHAGPLVVNTGKHTARAASDKFIVREASYRRSYLVGPV